MLPPAPSGRRTRSLPDHAPNTFKEAADANAWLSRVETAISHGDWRPPELSQQTFAAYGQRWLEQRTDLRPRTKELYEGLWRLWLKPAFPTITIGAMTPETWRAWFVKAKAEHPGSTQPAKAYRLARAMLNTAVDDGLLKSNPCRVKGAGRETSPERPIAMPDVVGRIAENMTDRYRPMVLLAAYCSLRFGELAGLRRARIDLLHRTITIEEQAVELGDGSTIFGPPKSAAGRRVVAFPGELVPMIEQHLKVYVLAAPDSLIFTSREGRPLRRTKFRPHWADACQRSEVTELHFHDLRGSGATWAATAGATVRELMGRLGHATPAMALRYQHATLERDQAIADRLGVLLRDERDERVS